MTTRQPSSPLQTSAPLPPPPPPPRPLHLTIRFSTSQPDLQLDIPSPQSTTVLSLKHLLRTRLASRSRLRLIREGRLLPDAVALSSVLKPPPSFPPPPPPSSSSSSSPDHDPAGKGKAVEGPPIARLYVNCAIGDELTPKELAAEAAAANNPPADHASSSSRHDAASAKPTASTQPRLRGFDRLLQGGFSASEVATLRTQFTTIHAARYTPDSMPSPDAWRSMEDAWIDTNAHGIPSSSDANPLEDEHAGMASHLEALFRAMMVGFFFPLGSLTWLLREEGVWSKRWQIFVGLGVFLSLLIGLLMGLSGGRD